MPSKAMVVLTGHLGQDAELRYTPQKKAVCGFSVATEAGGKDKKTTTWWRVQAWDKLGELCRNLRKSDLVQVTGEPSQRSYTDKHGEVKQSLEVNAREVLFLTPRRPDAQEAPQKPASNGWGAPAADDDVPF